MPAGKSGISQFCRRLVRPGSLYLAAAFAGIAPCRAGILDPVGPVGAGDKAILLDSLAIMLCIVVPVIVMTLAVAWWFRASNSKARYLPDWEFSGRIEIVVWSIPAMVVLFLGGVAWLGSHTLDPQRPLKSAQAPLQVQVVSMDWKWLFIYPQLGVASVNQLMLPVGRPVAFSITSADVMNSFFVPRLGSQIYAMAGMVTGLQLEADEPGNFPGFSAQFSGDGFSEMRFRAIAVPQPAFDEWVATARSSGGPALDEPAYLALAKPSEGNPVTTYHDVTPALFDRIVALSAPDTDDPALNEGVTDTKVDDLGQPPVPPARKD